MKMNKRGMHPSLWAILVIFAIFLLLIGGPFAYNFIKGAVSSASTFDLSAYLGSGEKIGDLVGHPNFNYVSYIFGEVPKMVVDLTSPIGATIVILAIFVILVLMFGDILTTFGSFSNPTVSWVIGAALAIIAANFKFVMMLSAIGFMLLSSVGVFAALLGILVPFVFYILVHVFLLANLKHLFGRSRNLQNFKTRMDYIGAGIDAFKGVGEKIVRSDSNKEIK
tara:strand:- start:49 stop:717 length:669 start_codon:yes stop_codon:yes gene_type:complete